MSGPVVTVAGKATEIAPIPLATSAPVAMVSGRRLFRAPIPVTVSKPVLTWPGSGPLFGDRPGGGCNGGMIIEPDAGGDIVRMLFGGMRVVAGGVLVPGTIRDGAWLAGRLSMFAARSSSVLSVLRD